MELQQVRAEQVASLARQEASHAASMDDLKELKQMFIKIQSNRRESPTPSVMIAAQTGAPFVEVTVDGAEMSQKTDEAVKNQNAYIRDISSMKKTISLHLPISNWIWMTITLAWSKASRLRAGP